MKEMRAQDAIPSVQNIESRQIDRQKQMNTAGGWVGWRRPHWEGVGHCWKVRISLGMTKASLDWFC